MPLQMAGASEEGGTEPGDLFDAGDLKALQAGLWSIALPPIMCAAEKIIVRWTTAASSQRTYPSQRKASTAGKAKMYRTATHFVLST